MKADIYIYIYSYTYTEGRWDFGERKHIRFAKKAFILEFPAELRGPRSARLTRRRSGSSRGVWFGLSSRKHGALGGSLSPGGILGVRRGCRRQGASSCDRGEYIWTGILRWLC